jgi:hypothetical protein
MVKYDGASRVLWRKQFGTASSEEAVDVVSDTAGNIYLAGRTAGALGGAHRGSTDAWVAKYDTAGRVLWRRQLGTTTWDDATGVAVDTEGNVYPTGDTDGALGGANRGEGDGWVGKYNAAGRLLWKLQIGTPGDDRSVAAATSAGHVYLVGRTYGALMGINRGSADAWVAKVSTR